MSWLFSQALVEEYLPESCLDGAQSAPLNGSRIQQAYCAPDKMTVFLRLSQFGMTYKPLTENLGKELLTLYLAGFRAKTSVPQEKAQALTENEAECGEKWHGSFTKYDPDTHSWKTHQCSLLGDLDEFSETWPQWGLMRNGECWEQRTLEQITNGTEFGLSVNIHPPPPTWPTPTAHMSKETNAPSEHKRNTPTLTAQVNWPTPNASDYRDRGNMSNPCVQKRMDVGKQLGLSMVVHPTSGKLNPMWVEWLMGWPLGWTDLKPLEMDKSHCVQQPLGES
jgi:hypothetical protein